METAAARVAIQKTSLKASTAGSRPAPIVVTEVRTAATVALDVEVPMDGTRL
jgi:hypothetical protein